MSEIKEQELSYTFTYSQDVLYQLKDWLDDNLTTVDRYLEVIDENEVRTRISDGKLINIVKKRIVDVSKLAVCVGVNFVPMVKRECVETVYANCSEKIKRLTKTVVYKTQDNVEIKFEQIYYEHNVGDTFDPLTTFKQLTLYNLLKPECAIDVTSNSHLGSDEILANCRLEFEYENELQNCMLIKVANLINFIESVVLKDVVIRPFLSHTSILNEICYRQFVEEKSVSDCKSTQTDIKLWALKLDGVRGKAYIINGKHIYIQLDDMQMFCGTLQTGSECDEINETKFDCNNFYFIHSESNSDTFINSKQNLPFLHNRILCAQVECIRQQENLLFYLTDVLCVYKYKYDNRNQYDVASVVNVDIFDAIAFMNTHEMLQFVTENNVVYTIRFQKFFTHMDNVYVKEDNDGYIGVTNTGNLIKIKPQKTYEMKCVANDAFVCSFGRYNSISGQYNIGAIYEVVIIVDNTVRVIKERMDRLISN
ncbi:lef-4 [Matsumuraeses phaseoli granulovirus]|uniref:Lef-4 n=1 Tax=Matsumuraeses phaseoli granulovirus TaxID=2760664 RepID=A0AAE7MLF4_9BBAC|nr:lef-4 [Matsumuraeses phaseoli granulovirus]QOD40049.1 lef-4 [Matsumuraeses phaseoli granulovirus]